MQAFFIYYFKLHSIECNFFHKNIINNFYQNEFLLNKKFINERPPLIKSKPSVYLHIYNKQSI